MSFDNPEPRMQPVDSSTVAGVGYDQEARILYLRFRRTGETYAYSDVGDSVVDGLLNAESKGQYFNEHIRDRYPHTKVPD